MAKKTKEEIRAQAQAYRDRLASTPEQQQEASITAQYIQAAVDANEPVVFPIGDKIYKIKRPCNAVSRRVDKMLLKAGMLNKDNEGQTIATFEVGSKVIPQCISLYMLANPIKVFFFHWIKWRWLHWFGSQNEYAIMLQNIMSRGELHFFFQNMALLRQSNQYAMTISPTMKNTNQKQS